MHGCTLSRAQYWGVWPLLNTFQPRNVGNRGFSSEETAGTMPRHQGIDHVPA
jgi:hypothetical protein